MLGTLVPNGLQAQVAEVDEKAERYLDAYMMYNDGERTEKEGNLEEALRKYREASGVFDSLAKTDPGWETNMIGMRRRKVADSMARVQGMLQREIAKVRKAKAEHSGEKSKNRRRIGFQPS
jgi:hypothetical protein